MKKAAAFITAILMCTCIFSCSDKNSTPKVQTIDANLVSVMNPTADEADLPDEITSIYTVYPLSDGKAVLLSASTADRPFVLYKSDDNLRNFKEISLGDFPKENSYDCTVSSDGSIILVFSSGDGMVTFRKHDSDGKVISENIAEIDSENTGFYISGIISADGNNCILGIDGRYYAADVQGTIYGELKIDSAEKTINRAGVNSDGELVCLSESEDGTAVYTAVITDSRLQGGENVYSLTESVSMNPFASHDGKHSILFPAKSGVYGVRSEDNVPERLFAYTDLLIEPDNVSSVCSLSDGRFAVAQNTLAGSPKLTVLSEGEGADASDEPVEKRNVKVAVSMKTPELEKAAVRYNTTHDDSRIALVEYGPSGDENAARTADDLKLEIIAGDIPDIIDVSLISGLGLEKFGMYTDLYPFLDSDEELSRESFIPSVFTVCEKDGKLLSLPVTCNTIYITAGKTKFFGDFTELTDEYIMGLAEKYPDKLIYANRSNSSNIIFQTFDMHQFIDYDSYTCNFNSKKFIDILEFCTQYPAEGQYLHEYNENIRTEKALIGTFKVGDMYGLLDSLEEMFGEEDYTMLQMEAHYSVRVAITESCPDKNDAWEFMREVYDVETHMDNFESNFKNYGFCVNFPITVGQFEAQKAFLSTIEQNEELNLENFAINKNITEEQCDLAYNVLCEGDKVVENLNWDIYKIIYEETTECFGGGITPQECAERIQNRLSILLSERS